MKLSCNTGIQSGLHRSEESRSRNKVTGGMMGSTGISHFSHGLPKATKWIYFKSTFSYKFLGIYMLTLGSKKFSKYIYFSCPKCACSLCKSRLMCGGKLHLLRKYLCFIGPETIFGQCLKVVKP